YFVNGDGTMGSIHHLDTSTTGQPDSVMDITCRWGRQFFITWEHWDTGATASAIWGQLLYADETMDASFEIEPASTNRQDPAVASSGTNFLVAWEKNTSTYPDLVGRIVGETAPVAKFTIWPPSGYVTDDFQLDATGCTDEQTPAANLQVRWDWTDDGTYDTNWSTTQKFTQKFSLPGTHTIRMQVQDEYGLTDSTTDTVNIYNTNPKAAFTVNPSIGPPGTVFQFDASTSSDLETAVTALQVRWDWDNDGVFDTTWSTTKKESHVFTGSSGWIYPVLEVRDAQGLIGHTTQKVWVDNKPTASFTISPARGTVNTVFQFDGSGSSDPDLTSSYALDYLWDWDDDGTYDTSWSQNVTPSHTYATPGTYTVRLQVRQIAGSLTDTTTRQVTVDPIPAQAPNVMFTVTPAVGTPTQEFQFDASGCTDPNGSNAALEFRWDWENDGVYDTSWSTIKSATHVFGGGSATVTVRLLVRDSEGLTAVAERTVTISVDPGKKVFLPSVNGQ
ncbi:MAG: PKD domain-containing protein, partial [Caldilineaceae bacterium]